MFNQVKEEPQTLVEKVKYFYEKNAKKLNRLFKLTGFFIVFFTVFHFVYYGYTRYDFTTKLKRTANQISQLVDNVRTTYAVHVKSNTDIMKLMAASNTMPDFLVRDGKLYNVYGGAIIVNSSLPVINEKNKQPRATFKIAYQGLSKETCVALAQLDWGGEKSGLIAVAVGSIDNKGVDTALRDVEQETEGGTQEVTDADGNKKIINMPIRTLPTVGKPGDQFNPTPFGKTLAESGCACGKYRGCSFALRYYK